MHLLSNFHRHNISRLYETIFDEHNYVITHLKGGTRGTHNKLGKDFFYAPYIIVCIRQIISCSRHITYILCARLIFFCVQHNISNIRLIMSCASHIVSCTILLFSCANLLSRAHDLFIISGA